MDQKILEEDMVQLVAPNFTPALGPHLLALIVETCPHLNQTYATNREAANLIRTDDRLIVELEDAFQQRSFASIRRLGLSIQS
jgi:hypothetical protein